MNLGTVIRLIAVCSVFLVYTVGGIDLNRALQNENMQCFVPKYKANVNTTWLTTPRRWFYPVMSVLDLYIEGLASSTKRDAADLWEDELYYNACMTYDMMPGNDHRSMRGVITGFVGIQTPINADSNDGFRSINWRSPPPESVLHGKSYITLTDNKTFIFMVSCRQGRMTWSVITTYEPITEETNAIVEEHALSLGFKREYFTGLRYDTCPAYSRLTQQRNADHEGRRKLSRSSFLRQQPNQQRQQWGRRGAGQGWN